MGTWKLTAEDRDTEGTIRVDRSLSDLLRATSADEEQPATPRRWERDAFMLVTGLLVGVALFALIGRSSPAPAAPRPALAPPTAAPTSTPTSTPTPTQTPTAVPTDLPTEAPAVVAPEPTPCDPLNAPYTVRRQVFPIGSVVGISCVSAAEAEQHAADLAAHRLAPR